MEWTVNSQAQVLQKSIFVNDPIIKIYEDRKEQKEVKLSFYDFIQRWNGELPITVPELERLKVKGSIF